MLPHTTNRLPGRPSLLLAALLAGAVFTAAVQPARAADEVKTGANSLSKVPADAAFYSTSLRLREQVELLTKSNAWKVLHSLPLVKEGIAKAMAELHKDDGPLAMYNKLIESPENKELAELLLDSVSHEVFLYGGKGWNDFYALAMQINTAQQFGPLQALMSGKPEEANKARVRSILQALQANSAKIKIPEFVLGFKLKQPKTAVAHLGRLEKFLVAATAEVPFLKDRIKRVKVAGGDFLTLHLDGEQVPWDMVPIAEFEEMKDEFAGLIKHVKKTKLTVSLGIKDGYLLLGIAPTTKELESFGGTGKSLADRAEFKPLAKHADKKLLSIGYASKSFLRGLSGGQMNFDSLANTLKGALNGADLKEERKKAIAKDLENIVRETKAVEPRVGASMSFAFLGAQGIESYTYAYEQGAAHKDLSCTLQNHFGGNPIFAAAFAGSVDGAGYEALVHGIKTLYGHAEGVFFDKADDDAKNMYKEAAKGIFPLLKRLDDATRTLLIPSLKETGLGLVIDAKWSSKQWHVMLPEMPKAMPMLELGLLIGASDAKKFTAAMREYRITLNELYEKIRDAAPNKDNIPEFKIPAPEMEKSKHGTLYYYPLPEEVGLDKQFQPMFAVGKKIALIALSKKHAERLLESTTLKVQSGPLTRKGPLVGVAILNWPALVEAAEPWVEFAVQTAVSAQADDADLAKKAAEGILKQVRVAASILKAYKGFTSATYVEDGALVTHSESVFKDIPAGK